MYKGIYTKTYKYYQKDETVDRTTAIGLSLNFAKILMENDYPIISVYLFGSWVEGIGKEESDIDVAVVFNDFADKFSTQIELMDIRRDIDSRIEPHPIRKRDFNQENPFARQIINTGMKILQK